MPFLWKQKSKVLFLLLLFVGIFIAQIAPVTAANESYRWVDSTTIKIGGGDLKKDYDFKKGQTFNGNVNFRPQETVQHKTNCILNFTLALNTSSPGQGTLIVTGDFARTGNGPPVCSGSIVDSYNGKSVTLQNPENAGNRGSETAEQRRVQVTAAPKSTIPGDAARDEQTQYDLSNAPKSDVITLRRDNRDVQVVQSQAPTDSGSFLAYKATFENVDEGDYEVCSKEASNCAAFHKDFGVAAGPIVISGNNPPIQIAAISDSDIDCDAGPGLTFIVCAAIEFIGKTVSFIQDEIIIPFLKVSPLNAQDGDRTFEIWKNIRNLANVLLVPVFFVIIFSQALSLNIDAYTVKKILPKLVLATIFIQFSFYIAAIAVDITNVLGRGIGDLITAPLGESLKFDLTDAGSGTTGALGGLGLVLGGLATVGAIATGAIFVILLPLLLAMLAVFFTLVFRQILIILLAILAPVAFVAWILPNTERLFKLWQDLFLKSLAMYPLIVLLFAAGNIVASVASQTNPEAIGASTIGDIIGIAAIIVPLALVPATFKLAGTAILAAANGLSKLAGRVQGDDQKGLQKRLIERSQRARTDMAAGGGMRAFGFRPGKGGPSALGSRVGAFLGREGVRVGAGVENAAVGNFLNRVEGAVKDRGRSGVGGLGKTELQALSRGRYGRAELEQRLAEARATGDTEKVKGAEKSLSDYNTALDKVRPMMGNSTLRAAASQRLGMDFKDTGEADRLAMHEYLGETAAGNRIGEQIWGQTTFENRTRNPTAFVTDYKSGIPQGGELKKELTKAVMNSNIETLGQLTPDAVGQLDEQGVLSDLAQAPQGQAVLRQVAGTHGSMGIKAREIITKNLGNQAESPPLRVEAVPPTQQQPPTQGSGPGGLHVPGDDTFNTPPGSLPPG